MELEQTHEHAGAEQQMTTISHHRFNNLSDTADVVAAPISIIENMKEEYWLFVWPCSIVLAEYVWQRRLRFSRANVVEVLANMRKVSDLNNLKCKVLGLTWGLWDTPIFNLHPNIILGADVLYNANAGIISLIELLMVKWGLKYVRLLVGFSFILEFKAYTLSGNIQLAEIILNGN